MNLNYATKTTIHRKPAMGLPWTGLSLLVAVTWMLSLAFTPQEEIIQTSPTATNAEHLHPFLQLGVLSGLHLLERDSLYMGVLNGTERLAKVSAFGR